MSTATTDFNFFDLLELDPDAPWDQVAFEKALVDKKMHWSKAELSAIWPEAQAAAKAKQKWVKDQEHEMAHESFRRLQAEHARAARVAHRADKTAQLDLDLQDRLVKGFVWEGEVISLAEDYKDVLTEAEIRRRIPVEMIRTKAARAARATARLEPTTWNVIARHLDTAGTTDLYDFLRRFDQRPEGVPTSSLRAEATSLLASKAREIQAAYRKKGGMERTAQNDAVKDLAGYCLTIFRDDAQRSRYEQSLADARFSGLLKRVDRIGSSGGLASRKSLEHLIGIAAREFHLDVGEAENRIRERADEKGWVIPEAEGSSPSVMWTCGPCRRANLANDHFCAGCGMPAASPCLKCAAVVPSAHRSCGECGFPVGNEAWVRHLLAESVRVEKTEGPATALARLAEAASDWPTTKGSLADEIAARRRELKETTRQYDKAIAQVRDLVSARSFYAARAAIDQLEKDSQSGGEEVSRLCLEVTKVIAETEQRVAEVRRDGRSSDATVLACQEILRLCTDSAQARELLMKIPPSPPSSLQADLRAHTVSLRWLPSPSRGITYTVIRKAGSRPSSWREGGVAGTTPGTRLDDSSPDIGLPLYYAVFADRDGVISIDAAHAPKPVFVMQDVRSLTAQASDGLVHLSWVPPARALRVFAVRSSTGRPAGGPAGAARLESLDQRQLVDSGLANGRTYHYTVYAEFAGPDGSVTSSGAEITAFPHYRPSTIDELEIQSVLDGKQRAVQIGWTKPVTGEVRILRTSRAIEMAEPIIPAQGLNQLGQNLVGAPPLVDRPSGLQPCYYTAAVIVGQTAYLGRSNRFVALEDVSGLKGLVHGSRIRFTWDWPAECASVVLTYSTRDWPRIGDTPGARLIEGARRVAITRAEYDRTGSWELAVIDPGDYFAIVQAASVSNEGTFLAPAKSEGARALVPLNSRVTLHYKIRRGRFGGRLFLDVTSDQRAVIPGLVLVHKTRTHPLNRDDGERILDTDASVTIDGKRSFQLPNHLGGVVTYARLFFKDDATYAWVTVRHPSPKRTRITMK